MDSFFHHPSDLENGLFVMEIKVTPPSADNTPPTSPVRQSNYSQPFLPTPRCNIVCYSPSAAFVSFSLPNFFALPPAQNPFSPERPTQSKTPLLSRIRTWLRISMAITNRGSQMQHNVLPTTHVIWRILKNLKRLARDLFPPFTSAGIEQVPADIPSFSFEANPSTTRWLAVRGEASKTEIPEQWGQRKDPQGSVSCIAL